MANLNIKSKEENTYDAIVIGSGISGGWAAKELCQKGLKTLVLERGRDVKHGDYPTANMEYWDLPFRDRVPQKELDTTYRVQSRTGWAINQATKHWFVDDEEHPYTEKKRFDWIRGYQVGGRSLIWGRHCYRWSEMDFTANEREGIATPWPIGYKDIEPWYDYVERFVGIAGMKEGLAQCPDGQFLPPLPMNCVEKDFREKVAKHFDGRVITIGRVAHLTQPHNGRGKCQNRNRCMRGCPFGAYFSSNSATIPVAMATGNFTIRPHSIVHEIIYDKDKKKAIGVRITDALSKETKEYFSRIIFCNASTLGSTQILMNSKSERFPNGLGNDSDVLGRYIMDHHFRYGASANVEGFESVYYKGRRPTECYVPRFRNIDKKSERKDYIRGFGFQGGASRAPWWRLVSEYTYGADLKEAALQPGNWNIGLMGFGETLPYEDNRVTLNEDKRDKWGLPTLNMDVEYKENEKAMKKDMMESAAEMLDAAGYKDVDTWDMGSWPGLGIHEMGGARMGKDSKTSVLNKNNQVHGVPNLFITDGSCMTSSACQNPSITYMALTARACDFAVKELKKQNL